MNHINIKYYLICDKDFSANLFILRDVFKLTKMLHNRFSPNTTNIFSNVKDAMPVSFRSELFTSYIVTIFKQRNLLP